MLPAFSLRVLIRILAICVLANFVPPAHARVGETLANGKNTVEFIGLEKLSGAEIHRLLGGTEGGAVHYCSADLVSKTGVVAASVVVHAREGGGLYTVVTVLEPPRAGDGKLRTAPAEELVDVKRLEGLAALLDADESIRNVVHLFGAARLRMEPAELSRQLEELFGEIPVTGPAFALLDGLKDDELGRIALAATQRAGPTSTRRAAIAALANFADREETWRALVVACIDSEVSVRDDARVALLGLQRFGCRKVDWGPVGEEIEQVLLGANLWALPAVIESLACTQIDPALARKLVSAAPRLLLAYATANHAATNAPARRLLAIASGKDPVSEPEAWRAFAESLR